MDFFQTSAVFLIPILVALFVQIIKFIIYSIKHGLDWSYAFTHGHMPSSHTAFAIALLTSIGHYEGMHSGVFAVTAGLAFIIVDDALRIRMILGDQGRYRNMLVDQLKNEIDESKFPRLKERVGHRTSEVVVGGILGFFLTWIFIILVG